MREKEGSKGFTLIELLVVIAIIGLLASVLLIALSSARQKSRDAKRVADMVQMNTGLELYFATYRGYPSSVSGQPTPLVPEVTTSIPSAPLPADGGCESVGYPLPVPSGNNGDIYYYYPSGTSYLTNGVTVYPDYAYYFCIGNKTGDLPAGMHILTPTGLK